MSQQTGRGPRSQAAVNKAHRTAQVFLQLCSLAVLVLTLTLAVNTVSGS